MYTSFAHAKIAFAIGLAWCGVAQAQTLPIGVINAPPTVIGNGVSMGAGTTLNVSSGGQIGNNFRAFAGTLNISGGRIGDGFAMHEAAVITVTGGTFGRGFGGRVGNAVEFRGSEFKVNGVLINEASTEIGIPSELNVYTGTFADGSPFLFSTLTSDSLLRVKLIQVDLTAADTTPLIVDSGNSSSPAGLRAGQTLFLHGEGEIGPDFAAIDAVLFVEGGFVGPGLDLARSTVHLTAGSIGSDVFAAESAVHMSGGYLGAGFHAFGGTSLKIDAGVVGSGLQLDPGSTLEITGGTVGQFARASWSTVTIEGGTVDRGFRLDDSFVAIRGGNIGPGMRLGRSSANISGGTIEGTLTASASTVNISGGTIDGPFVAAAASKVQLIGKKFILDGVTLDLQPGVPTVVAIRDVPLSGVLADGSPFEFDLFATIADGRDFFQLNTELTLLLVPEPATFALVTLGLLALTRRCRG